VTNPFRDRTIKEIEREVLNKKNKRHNEPMIEVLPNSKITRITGSEDE
jgi:hypothetical protein